MKYISLLTAGAQLWGFRDLRQRSTRPSQAQDRVQHSEINISSIYYIPLAREVKVLNLCGDVLENSLRDVVSTTSPAGLNPKH